MQSLNKEMQFATILIMPMIKACLPTSYTKHYTITLQICNPKMQNKSLIDNFQKFTPTFSTTTFHLLHHEGDWLWRCSHIFRSNWGVQKMELPQWKVVCRDFNCAGYNGQGVDSSHTSITLLLLKVLIPWALGFFTYSSIKEHFTSIVGLEGNRSYNRQSLQLRNNGFWV
jgi:hypothetical protein